MFFFVYFSNWTIYNGVELYPIKHKFKLILKSYSHQSVKQIRMLKVCWLLRKIQIENVVFQPQYFVIKNCFQYFTKLEKL